MYGLHTNPPNMQLPVTQLCMHSRKAISRLNEFSRLLDKMDLLFRMMVPNRASAFEQRLYLFRSTKHRLPWVQERTSASLRVQVK